MILQVTTQIGVPESLGLAAQLQLQQQGTKKPRWSSWEALFGFIEWSFTPPQRHNK